MDPVNHVPDVSAYQKSPILDNAEHSLSSFERLNELILCPISHEPLHHPHIIVPCQHRISKDIAKKIFGEKFNNFMKHKIDFPGAGLPCPVCRTPVEFYGVDGRFDSLVFHTLNAKEHMKLHNRAVPSESDYKEIFTCILSLEKEPESIHDPLLSPLHQVVDNIGREVLRIGSQEHIWRAALYQHITSNTIEDAEKIALLHPELFDEFDKIGNWKDSPIVEAIRQNRPDMIITFATHYPELKNKYYTHRLLKEAITHDNPRIVHVLKALGFRFDAYDAPLLIRETLRSNHMQMAQALLECGVNVNKELGNGYTLLTLAAKEHDLALMQKLKDLGVTQFNESDHNQETPLFLAIYSDDIDIARALLAWGVDKNEPKSYQNRYNAIQVAEMFGTERMKALLKSS